MNKTSESKGIISIITAGVFWGSMGLFVRSLSQYGLSSSQIASLRIIVAAIIFSLILLIKDRKGFRIKLKDIPLFLGLGLCSILFFTVCYFKAISLMSMSAAAILLYTSPLWVMLMSVIVFKEKITVRKIIALLFAFGGCILVSGFGSITPFGLLVGLCSGIGYGLYSILGTFALRKYSVFTVTAYTFIVAGIGSFFVSRPKQMFNIILSDNKTLLIIIMLILLTGFVTAVVPFLLYTYGLQSVKVSDAAVIVTIEPVVASALGVIVYKEAMTLMSLCGIICVLSAIVILNIRKTKIQ